MIGSEVRLCEVRLLVDVIRSKEDSSSPGSAVCPIKSRHSTGFGRIVRLEPVFFGDTIWIPPAGHVPLPCLSKLLFHTAPADSELTEPLQ